MMEDSCTNTRFLPCIKVMRKKKKANKGTISMIYEQFFQILHTNTRLPDIARMCANFCPGANLRHQVHYLF